MNTVKQEYVDRWNRIHEVNKEKRRQHLEAAGKREEAATITKWKDDNPNFTYVELSEERKRAAEKAAVYMEQWAAEHPPPTAAELEMRDKDAEAAAKDAVTVHFVKNLPVSNALLQNLGILPLLIDFPTYFLTRITHSFLLNKTGRPGNQRGHRNWYR